MANDEQGEPVFLFLAKAARNELETLCLTDYIPALDALEAKKDGNYRDITWSRS